MGWGQIVETCITEGCDRPRHARGFCKVHYERARYPQRHRSNADGHTRTLRLTSKGREALSLGPTANVPTVGVPLRDIGWVPPHLCEVSSVAWQTEGRGRSSGEAAVPSGELPPGEDGSDEPG